MSSAMSITEHSTVCRSGSIDGYAASTSRISETSST